MPCPPVVGKGITIMTYTINLGHYFHGSNPKKILRKIPFNNLDNNLRPVHTHTFSVDWRENRC